VRAFAARGSPSVRLAPRTPPAIEIARAARSHGAEGLDRWKSAIPTCAVAGAPRLLVDSMRGVNHLDAHPPEPAQRARVRPPAQKRSRSTTTPGPLAVPLRSSRWLHQLLVQAPPR